MNVLLVQPEQGSRFGISRIVGVEPLGLECVGAAIQSRGHPVTILDMRLGLDGWDEFERLLGGLEPPVVGIAAGFTSDVYPALETAAHVKRLRPQTRILVGGHHASLAPDDFVFPGSPVDAVAVGEGEWTALEFVEAVERGTPALASVAGVRTVENRRHGFTPRPFTHDFDALPPPDRTLTRRYRRRYHQGFLVPSACVETSRGCPFDCNFCSVWIFYQRRARRRAPARIVEELKGIDEHHVFFTDDIAFLERDSYRELGERIRAEGIRKSFAADTRTDLVVRYRDLFDLWREGGLQTVFLGVEMVTEEGLRSVRKRNKTQNNLLAIEILRDKGITPMTSMIVDPQWEEADFDRLAEWIVKLDLPNPTFTVLTPLPGTELFEERKHEIANWDYRWWDVIHTILPTRLPLERFYERYAGMFRLTTRDTRPTWAAVKKAASLAASGNFWCMKRIYDALQEMRTPEAFLRQPPYVRAPGSPPIEWKELTPEPARRGAPAAADPALISASELAPRARGGQLDRPA